MKRVGSELREIFVAAMFLCVMVLIAVLRWPWSDGLWLDETLSAWTVSAGLQDAWRRALDFQTQSPLFYVIEWFIVRAGGSSEVSLRLVSIIAAIGSAGMVSLLAARFSSSRSVPLYAAGFLLGCDVFQVGAITARPYSLATFSALLSIYASLLLREMYSHRRAFLWVAATLMTWYAHYLFIAVALANVITVARNSATLRKTSMWLLILFGTCLPGAIHFFELRSRASGLLFTRIPGFPEILMDCVPMPLVVAATLGAVMAYIWQGRVGSDRLARATPYTLLPYLVVAPVTFMLLAVLTGGAVWLPRYWEWQTAVCTIVAAVLLGRIDGAPVKSLALLVAAFFIVVRGLVQTWHSEEWRSVGRVARAYAGPIVLYSGLIEAESMDSSSSAEFQQYVRAPLSVYGRTENVFLARLSGSEEELRVLFEKPALLIAAAKTVGSRRSPQRFLDAATTMGRSVKQVETNSSLITIHEIR